MEPNEMLQAMETPHGGNYVSVAPPNGQPQNNRQQNQRPSISTSLLSMWDANQNGMKFNVTALDSGLSVGMWVPFVGPDGRRSYPKEQRYMTVLSQKNCMLLEDMIVNKMLPEYMAGKNCRYGVFTNSAKSTMFELETRDGEFFANLYIGCDATTHVAQSTLRFKFESSAYVTSYDPTTGIYDTEPLQVDFFIFLKTIQGFNKLCAGLIAGHGKMVAGNFQHVRLMNYIQAIANAVHAQLPAPTYVRPMTGNGPMPSPIPQAPTATPAMTEVSALSDLM